VKKARPADAPTPAAFRSRTSALPASDAPTQDAPSQETTNDGVEA
jgi:hypothetical protein